MAKKIRNTFYNKYYYKFARLSELDPETKMSGVIKGNIDEKEIEELKKQFQVEVVNVSQLYDRCMIVFKIKFLKEIENNLKERGYHLQYSDHLYVKQEIPEGYLYSGWRTGRKTKIRPEDLPESFVYLSNYKKCGYLQTAGVTDVVYKPYSFHDHTFKYDFLFISYHGVVEIKNIWDDVYDEYVFGNDIIDVILGIEKYNPDLSEKVNGIKKAMVKQYNLYCQEQGSGLTKTKKIEKIEDLL